MNLEQVEEMSLYVGKTVFRVIYVSFDSIHQVLMTCFRDHILYMCIPRSVHGHSYTKYFGCPHSINLIIINLF